MKYEEFLQLKIEEQNKKNIEDFIMYLNSSAGKTKVKNFLQRNSDLPVQNIVQDAKNGNPYAIALLRKDPTKQNISEKTFFEFTGLKKMPQVGSDSVRFGNSKAADFKIGEWYGTQKYIKEAGGAQDNQVYDAAHFAIEANKLGKKALVCIDGDYGKTTIKQYLTNNENCIILSADELKEGIDNGRFD